MQSRVRPASAGLSRLLSTVEELPWRYAPFFTRIGALWDLPEHVVAHTLARAADRREWRTPAMPGIRVIDVSGGEQTRDCTLHLVHFAAGTRFPAHRHVGQETLLVLEGSYTDSLGRRVQAGDTHTMLPDTAHSLQISGEGPCVAASIHGGIEFTARLVRWWSLLMGQ